MLKTSSWVNALREKILCFDEEISKFSKRVAEQSTSSEKVEVLTHQSYYLVIAEVQSPQVVINKLSRI